MTSAPMNRIELLAPAKNLTCGLAAIDHGADAVYIGGPGFSARAAAANSLSDIKELVLQAHLYGVRVYVALNTVFDDAELPRVVELCYHLYNIDVDALIIQDTGLLMSELPPIELHSSTQMNNRSAERVRFWQDVGFTQVVLARELSLDQIREIAGQTEVVLEAFVHGALCVSYSGQCYISEVMAGRSANRGACAQFCRHKYDLRDTDGKDLVRGKYLLSLKDLDLSAHLSSLVDAGIRSFKIEGRLKDVDYVKNVTAFYRNKLDEIIAASPELCRASSGTCSFAFKPDPARSFSRGKTSYFLTKKRNTAAEIRSPKSVGKLIGKVTCIEKGVIRLATDEKIHNGDGLCFFDSSGELVGIRVNRVEKGLLYPKGDARHLGLEPGMELYRNADSAFSKQLGQSENCRKIVVDFNLAEMENGLQLSITDEDGVRSRTMLKFQGEPAKNREAVRDTASRQLRKSGGTVYRIQAVQVELTKGLYYPAAVFNELRRDGLAAHSDKRLAHFRPQPGPERVDKGGKWPEGKVSYLDNICNKKAEQFYLAHGVAAVDRSRLSAKDVDRAQLMTTKYCVRAQIGKCPKDGGAASSNPLYLSDNTGEYELRFDCKKCEMQVRRKK